MLAVNPHLLEGILEIRSQARKFLPRRRGNSLKSWFGKRRTLRLWIDAICIHQHDNIEKVGQIPLMAQIYSNAQRVLVWLGAAADGSEILMENLERLEKTLTNIDRTLARHEYTAAGLPSSDNSIWNAVASFFGRPWFRRLWVIQEIVLANGVFVVCGSKSVDFQTLASFSIGMSVTGIAAFIISSRAVNNAILASNFRLALSSIGVMHSAYTTKSESEYWALCGFLDAARGFEVREPVDRVYGMLGLLGGRLASITPDYTPGACEQYWNLYHSVAVAILENENREGRLQILNFAALDTQHPMLPSWVPNWNNHQPFQHFSGMYNPELLLEGSNQPFRLLNFRSLKVHGFVVATVVGTSPLRHHSMDTGDPSQPASLTLTVIKDALAIYHDGCQNGIHNKTLVRSARTLIADIFYDSSTNTYKKYPQDTAEDFGWYMQYLEEGASGEENPHIRENFHVSHVDLYMSILSTIWKGRSFFVTDKGYIGLASQACQIGDKVCIIFSAETPFIFRQSENKDSFTLVSDAYVDGLMWGGALEGRDKSLDRDFIIE